MRATKRLRELEADATAKDRACASVGSAQPGVALDIHDVPGPIPDLKATVRQIGPARAVAP